MEALQHLTRPNQKKKMEWHQLEGSKRFVIALFSSADGNFPEQLPQSMIDDAVFCDEAFMKRLGDLHEELESQLQEELFGWNEAQKVGFYVRRMKHSAYRYLMDQHLAKKSKPIMIITKEK